MRYSIVQRLTNVFYFRQTKIQIFFWMKIFVYKYINNFIYMNICYITILKVQRMNVQIYLRPIMNILQTYTFVKNFLSIQISLKMFWVHELQKLIQYLWCMSYSTAFVVHELRYSICGAWVTLQYLWCMSYGRVYSIWGPYPHHWVTAIFLTASGGVSCQSVVTATCSFGRYKNKLYRSVWNFMNSIKNFKLQEIFCWSYTTLFLVSYWKCYNKKGTNAFYK